MLVSIEKNTTRLRISGIDIIKKLCILFVNWRFYDDDDDQAVRNKVPNSLTTPCMWNVTQAESDAWGPGDSKLLSCHARTQVFWADCYSINNLT